MKLTLISNTGKTQTLKAGYSFPVLFFGYLAPLFRGDFRNFGILLGLQFLALIIIADAGGLLLTTLLVSGTLNALYASVSNKRLLNTLLANDWQIVPDDKAPRHAIDIYLGYTSTDKVWY